MALLQFMQAGKKKVAVPTTVHCDHLIQAKIGADEDLQNAINTSNEVFNFLESVSDKYGIGFWKPGAGIILFGDKTGLGRTSAFDRINVRRLFIYLEDAISRAAKDVLFEFNDEITRTNFVNTIEPFLRDVQANRGIFDYVVICDETNNTAAVIDANEFKADIYIKPARSINFIGLTFIATKTGVDFEEVIGNF